MAKKKKKESFKTFHNLEKSKFKTIKTTLKSILLNHNEIQPLITNIVFEVNDLIHLMILFQIVLFFLKI